MANEKFTRFAFTCPHPTDKSAKYLDLVPGIDLLFYGREVGPQSGTPHLQGYFEVKEPLALFKVVKILKGFFVKPAIASRLLNYIYCSKQHEFSFVLGKDKEDLTFSAECVIIFSGD